MAIQAQMYPDNIMMGMPTTIGSQQQDYWACGGLAGVGVGVGGFGFGSGLDSSSSTPDHLHLGYLNPSQPQQQQQFYLQQQQQLQIHQPQLKSQFLGLGNSSSSSNDGLLFLPSSTKNPAVVVPPLPPPSIIAPAVDECNSGQTNGVGGVASTAFEQTVVAAAAQMEKQRIEMESYVDLLQSQTLKQALQERRRHHTAALLSKIELKASALLRDKDEQLAIAAKRATDLEEVTRRVEEESTAWKRVAWENEAMVAKLNAALDNLIRDREQRHRQSEPQREERRNVEDAESCCEENEVGEEEEEGVSGRREEEGGGVAVGRKRKRRVEEATERRRGGVVGWCKGGWCESGELCVLFLPCRHLCSCVDCEVFMDACPICKSPKKAIIQALFS